MTRHCSKQLLASLGLMLFAGEPVSAQQSVVEHCRNTSSDADRIACLEAALIGKESAVRGEPETVASPKPEAKPLSDVTPKPETIPSGIGADQVVARTQSREELLDSLEKADGLAVASYATVPYQRLVVTLENGQQWRQIKGDTKYIRVNMKRNQTVDINESSLGGYILTLNEMRLSVRVERIK